MTITPSEAEEALAAIRNVSQQMRRALNAWGIAYHLIIWGIIWLIGFTCSQFILAPAAAGYIWMGLDLVGAGLSWYFGIKMGRRFRSPFGARVGLFWLALMVYGFLGMWFVHPVNAREGALLLVIFLMFAWVAMGIWVETRISWLGLFVTALALIGYFFLPDFFFIFMAVLGGGSLLGTGLYILRNWK
jgi:hypothetical protein